MPHQPAQPSPEPAPPKKDERFFSVRYLLWLVAASLLLLGMIEGGLRLLGFDLGGGGSESGPCPGMPVGPCVRGRQFNGPEWIFGAGTYTLNDLRHRSPPLRELTCKRPVLFSGDSFTFGVFVSDDETVPAALARALPVSLDACVYNGARPGDSLEDAQTRFSILVDQEGLKPWTLVHQVYGDDIYQNAGKREDLISSFAARHLYLLGITAASARLKLALAWRYEWARRRLGSVDINRYADPRRYQAWVREYARAWGAFMDEVGARGIRRVLWIVPFPAHMATGDVSHLEPLLAAARARDIPVLVLTRENLPEDPFLPNDMHFNPPANTRIGELLAPLILQGTDL